MTDEQRIIRDVQLMADVRIFLQDRIKTTGDAEGAVCSLTLLAVELAGCVCDKNPAQTRDMMVGALNLGLKHGLK